MHLWPVEHFFPGFFFRSGADLEKTEEKVFNWSEVHLSEATFYKIHTLVGSIKNILISAGTKNHRQHVKAK